MELVDLEPDDGRFIDDALTVLAELRPQLTAASALAIYGEGFPQGLRFTAVYLDGACVAVAGWRILATTVVGRKLYVDDLVTTESCRSQGVGRFLLAGLIDRAREAGCAALDLDSANHRVDAHRFYSREGFDKVSVHFALRLD
jgi:GNAT superfamily N-acetyltransferase